MTKSIKIVFDNSDRLWYNEYIIKVNNISQGGKVMAYYVFVLVEFPTEDGWDSMWMPHSGVCHRKKERAEQELKVAKKHFIALIEEVE